MKTILLSALSLLISIAASAGSKVEAMRNVVNGSYNYWFAQPDSTGKAEAKPIIIFLHGASLCGNDLNKVRRYGTLDAIDRGRNLDAYVIAPQNPGGAWSPSKIMKIVDYTLEHYNADPTRIYVLGMSLGGYGTIDLAAAYPDRIAAAMAVCGGGTSKKLGDHNKLPLWIIHGTADNAVGISESDKVVSAMRAADPSTPRLIYDRVPGMNHSQPARFFYLPQTYQWLMGHKLDTPNRPVGERFDILGSTHKAYAGLNHGRKSSGKSTAKSKTNKKDSKSKSTSKKSSKKSSSKSSSSKSTKKSKK